MARATSEHDDEAFELGQGRIRQLARGRERRIAAARQLARCMAIVTAFVWGAIVARRGLPIPRALGTSVFVGSIALTVLSIWWTRKKDRDPRAVLARLFGASDPQVRAVVRSLPLLTARDGTSHELARLAVEQRVAALREDASIARASRWGRAFWAVTMACLVASFASCSDGFRVFEGTNVALATKGVAPVPFPWLGEVSVRVRPPEYLHLPERLQSAYEPMTVFAGSALTFEGAPIHSGRALVLTDGKTRVPFADDGHGRVSARWTALAPSDLRVVAAFGRVDIHEPVSTGVRVTPDMAPEVVLDGAPKTIRWSELDASGEIPLRWEISDDHGLREVDLVLLSGEDEDRRALVQLDSDVRKDRGGHTLRASDPFLKRARAPVTIRIEAKDNDVVTGPKWGRSEAIILIMPAIGEQEALRAKALADARTAWMKALGVYDTEAGPKGSKTAVRDAVVAAGDETSAALAKSYGTLRIPAKVGRLISGKSKKAVTTARAYEGKGGPFSAAETASERVTLVVDAVLRGQCRRDAKLVSLALAEIADDARRGVHDVAAGSPSAQPRVAASIETLNKSAPHFRELGGLGADIGEIVVAYLRRYDRAEKAKDWAHAELVLEDLTLRLKTPDPSFGAKGEARGEAGASGGGEGADEAPEPDEVSSAFNEALGDLNRLSDEHRSQMEQLEQALEQARDKGDLDAIEEELSKHAKAVREAVKELPNSGPGSESFAGKAAQAKEQAEAMADALERKSLKEALMRGKQAEATLDDAKKAVRNRRAWSEPSVEAEADNARRALDRESDWVEKAMEAVRKRAEGRAKPKLAEQAAEEKRLAERAQDTSDRLRREDMPEAADQALQQAQQSMRKAERALKEGDSEGAGKHERDAQDKLEAAKQAFQGEEGSQENKESDGGQQTNPNGRTDVPTKKKDEKISDFRERVQRGMAKPGASKFRDAAKRYAEGLLR